MAEKMVRWPCAGDTGIARVIESYLTSSSMTVDYNVDISENELLRNDEELLMTLLKDRTTGHNILWATDDYLAHGEAYAAGKSMELSLITGEKGIMIQPRVKKNASEQRCRSREKAEVFTPAWLCNVQNNLVDEQWFGRAGVFNEETEKGWKTNTEPIPFPTESGKTWQDYVSDTRLEISCGEAPYLVSRYDVSTGESIPVPDRIGMLDRKMRVVSENTKTTTEWYQAARLAYQSIFGYELQGDSLLLARESLLFTFIDHFRYRFPQKAIEREELREIAMIISWNIWQMDGLKGVVPNSCQVSFPSYTDMFTGETKMIRTQCPGCEKRDIHRHNGLYCQLRDWSCKRLKTVTFVSMMSAVV